MPYNYQFGVNGNVWNIVFVHPTDRILQRSDGSFTVGVTSNKDKCIYISYGLPDYFFLNVLCHEITHVFCFEFGIILDLETEEMLADFVATYGRSIIEITDLIFRNLAVRV